MAEKWNVGDMGGWLIGELAEECKGYRNSRAYQNVVNNIMLCGTEGSVIRTAANLSNVVSKIKAKAIEEDDFVFNADWIEYVGDLEERFGHRTGYTPEEKQDRRDAMERTVDRIVDHAVEARLTRKSED